MRNCKKGKIKLIAFAYLSIINLEKTINITTKQIINKIAIE